MGIYDTEEHDLKSQGEALQAVVEKAEPALQAISNLTACEPVLNGGWSYKQLIGHLIDSAANNHQRFVRAALQGELVAPGYDQAGQARVQATQQADWPTLVTLWASYNRYLAHVIAHLPEDQLSAMCRIGNGEPVTLKFLVDDYLAHLKHHLQQIGLA